MTDYLGWIPSECTLAPRDTVTFAPGLIGHVDSFRSGFREHYYIYNPNGRNEALYETAGMTRDDITSHYSVDDPRSGDWPETYSLVRLTEAARAILARSLRPWQRPDEAVSPYHTSLIMRAPHPGVVLAWEHIQRSDFAEEMRLTAADTLARELPSLPLDGDPSRIAYTRDGDLSRERRTVGKLGGYLSRVFPGLSGSTIETIVSKARAAQDQFSFATGAGPIVSAMRAARWERGPRSCMTAEKFNSGDHPYSVFDTPEWRLYTRNADGKIQARALANMDKSIFVRVYGPCDGWGEFSHPDDPALRDYLVSQGLCKAESWEGCSLSIVETKDGEGIIAPYLDGCVTRVDEDGNICRNGEYDFRTQDGYISLHDGEVETISGDWISEDDAVYSTWHDGCLHSDDAVYSELMEDYILSEEATEFVNVSSSGREFDDYGVTDSRQWRRYVVEDVHGDYYHRDLCVMLDNGDYMRKDDENLVEIDDRLFNSESDDVVYSDELDKYLIAEDSEKALVDYTHWDWFPSDSVKTAIDSRRIWKNNVDYFMDDAGNYVPRVPCEA